MKILAAILALFARTAPAVEISEPVPDNVVVVPLKPVLDPRIQSIKKIASARIGRKPVDEEWKTGLSQRTQDWLSLLTTEMLLLVTSATQFKLREHIAGRRPIRGLLAADHDSIDAYREALKPKLAIVDHETRRSGDGGPKRSFGR
jgi:hypothetical protein